MTFEELKKLAEGAELKYFIAPDRPTLMMGFGGINGNYQVAVKLELDGRFVQFRTVGYLSCPSDHPHVDAVLRLLGELDFQLRLVKFGWDPTDGEIAAYVDVWLEDGTITQKQFSAMLQCFIPGIDFNHQRISKTIETGSDPGELKPEDVLAQASGLPAKVKSVLEQLAGKKPDDESEGPEEV